MKAYSVRVFATADVCAESEEHARHILESMAEAHSKQVVLTQFKADKNAQGDWHPGVFVYCSIDQRAELIEKEG